MGFFSLDGLHPTAIGQGLIAHEFMRVMAEVGVPFTSELVYSTIHILLQEISGQANKSGAKWYPG